MRRKSFWIAAGCILAVVGLRPVFSSGAAPASTEEDHLRIYGRRRWRTTDV
jgi:hypothetical protein